MLVKTKQLGDAHVELYITDHVERARIETGGHVVVLTGDDMDLDDLIELLEEAA